ncbi:MAG TPA: Hint domain-containing protein [Polyangiaceae bacterium]|nr:Hint domain-containing protein [Polyangiaceae bacterium]
MKGMLRTGTVGIALACSLAGVSCDGTNFSSNPNSGGSSSSGSGSGGISSGGAGHGGTNSGGTSHGGTAGSSHGGSSTGGSSSGEAGRGGSSNGGTGNAGASTGGSGNGGSSSGGVGVGGSSGAGCPDAAPASGAHCNVTSTGFDRAQCSYGDDPRPQCRTLALCSQNQWQVTQPDPNVCGDGPLGPNCPTSKPANGTMCADTTLSCWYDESTECHCSECAGGSGFPVCQIMDPPLWACTSPAQGCPSPLPQAGAPCDDPTLNCGLSCDFPIRCTNGAWVYGQEMCPICASPDTPIDTPTGERAIAQIHVGDLVYSVENNAVVTVPVLAVGSTPVAHHHVLRVELDDGTVLEISPGHPTADGHRFSDLKPGIALDSRHHVRSVTTIPYRFDRTYDILPATPSGTYFAGGALIGSTLRRDTSSAVPAMAP